MDSAVVPSALVPLLLGAIRDAGGDSSAVCRKLGVAEHEVSAGAPSIRVDVLHALTDIAVRVTADPYLGLHLGAAHLRGLHGALEMVCSVAPTLGTACARFVEYARLLHPRLELALVKDGSSVRLERALPLDFDRRRGCQVQEFIVATLVQVGHRLTSGRLHIERVWLARERPESSHEFERVLGTSAVEFGADTVGLQVPSDQLDLPCASADEAMDPLLEEYAKRLLDELPAPAERDPLVGLRAALRAELARGPVRLEDIAARMAMSPRTLQRQIASAGTTFQRVLDEVRSRLARHYLEDLALHPNEAAARLGYSEPRAFYRALKRWARLAAGEQRVA